MQPEHFNGIELLWPELPVERISHSRRHGPVDDRAWKVEYLRKRKSPHSIPEYMVADVGNAVLHSIIGLDGRGQCACPVEIDLYSAFAPSFHFLAPLFIRSIRLI